MTTENPNLIQSSALAPVEQFAAADAAGRLIALEVANDAEGAAQHFLQLHDTDAAIINGAVPAVSLPIPNAIPALTSPTGAKQPGRLSLALPWEFDDGCVIALSTTRDTFTGAASLTGAAIVDTF